MHSSPVCFNLLPSASGPPLPVRRPAAPLPDLPSLTSLCICVRVGDCVSESVCGLLDEPDSLWSGVIKAERRSKRVIAVIWQRLQRLCRPIRAFAWPPPAPLQSQSSKSAESRHTLMLTQIDTSVYQPQVRAWHCYYQLKLWKTDYTTRRSHVRCS